MMKTTEPKLLRKNNLFCRDVGYSSSQVSDALTLDFSYTMAATVFICLIKCFIIWGA